MSKEFGCVCFGKLGQCFCLLLPCYYCYLYMDGLMVLSFRSNQSSDYIVEGLWHARIHSSNCTGTFQKINLKIDDHPQDHLSKLTIVMNMITIGTQSNSLSYRLDNNPSWMVRKEVTPTIRSLLFMYPFPKL